MIKKMLKKLIKKKLKVKQQLFLSVKCVISKPTERTTLPFTWALIIEESSDRDRDSDKVRCVLKYLCPLWLDLNFIHLSL